MKKNPVSIKTAMIMGAASSCLLPHLALAQAAGQGVAEVGNLAEIIVTARKREESIQSVPVAVSVQTGETLQQHQINDVYSLQAVTPSLQVLSGFANADAPSFSIRGIGTAILGIQAESTVGLVVDDVPIARSEMANIQFFDIDRVEVLRGPQGMLFGKNAAGGLISITTGTPKLGTTEFSSYAQYGYLPTAASAGNTAQVNVMGNLPVGNTAALRLAGFFTFSDGYGKNVFQPDQFLGEQDAGLRGKFLWQASDSISMLLAGDYSVSHGPGGGVQFWRYADPAGVLSHYLTQDGLAASPDQDKISAEGVYRNQAENYGGSLKANFDLGRDYTLTSVTAYRERNDTDIPDADSVSINILSDYKNVYHFDQFSQEFRFASPATDRFTYQVGLFYQELNASSDAGPNPTDVGWVVNAVDPARVPFGLTPQIPGFPYFSSEENLDTFKGKTAAVFGEGAFKITDALRLTLGARYTHDDLDYRAVVTSSPAGQFPTLFGRDIIPVQDKSNSTTQGNTSYRAILDYQITPDTMVYGSYSRGYKGPTFDALSTTVVAPEIPTNYELGLKSTMLNNRLRLNVALFDETFNGFQTQITTATAAATVSAGKLKDRGAELELTANPVQGFTINAGVTYLNTKYEDVPTLNCYPNEPIGTGDNLCTGFPNVPGSVTSVNGNQLALAPNWTETLTLRYEHPLWSGWDGFVQGNGYFRSSFNFTPYNDPRTELGDTHIYGLNLGLASQDGRIVVTLFARNLTDERVPQFIYLTGTSAFSQDGGGLHLTPTGFVPYIGRGDYAQQFGPDSFRTIGISASFHW